MRSIFILFTRFLYLPRQSFAALYARSPIVLPVGNPRVENKNGSAVHRVDGAVRGTDLWLDSRLPKIDQQPGGAAMNMSWMTWVAGLLSVLLFVYLVYALLRAEDLE